MSTVTATATRYTNEADVDLSAADLGFDDAPVSAYIGEGSDDVVVEYRDGTLFHLMRDYISAGRVLAEVADDEGDANSLAQWLRGHYPYTFGDVETRIDGDQWQAITFTVRAPLPDGGLTAAEIGAVATEFVNTLTNLTDPGTFAVAYLYDEVAAWQERAIPAPSDTATLAQAATFAGMLLACDGNMYADEDTASARAAREAFVKATATSTAHGETYRVSADGDQMRAAMNAFTL